LLSPYFDPIATIDEWATSIYNCTRKS